MNKNTIQMKNTFYFLLMINFFSFAFVSCENEDYEIYNEVTPVSMTLSELRSSVKTIPPAKNHQIRKNIYLQRVCFY
jgi:hypothetical protein